MEEIFNLKTDIFLHFWMFQAIASVWECNLKVIREYERAVAHVRVLTEFPISIILVGIQEMKRKRKCKKRFKMCY